MSSLFSRCSTADIIGEEYCQNLVDERVKPLLVDSEMMREHVRSLFSKTRSNCDCASLYPTSSSRTAACVSLWVYVDATNEQPRGGAVKISFPGSCADRDCLRVKHVEFVTGIDTDAMREYVNLAREEPPVERGVVSVRVHLVLKNTLGGSTFWPAYTRTIDIRKSCSRCGERSLYLKRCSRCHVALYCGETCQRQHWRDGHKDECQASE